MRKMTGFTIMEMVVVVVIVAVMAIFISIAWPGNTINVDAQAQQLASDLRYMQKLAVSRKENYCMTLTAGTPGSYSLFYGSTCASSFAHPGLQGSNTVTFDSNIALTVPGVLSNNMVVFGADGTPYINNTGTTELTSTAAIQVSGGGRTMTVNVQPYTGLVEDPS